MDYYDAIPATYTFEAVNLAAAAEVGHFVGPPGHVGRLVGITTAVTTAVTTAASSLSLGSAADADAYATASVAVGAADTVQNAITNLTTDDNYIAADEIVVLTCGGEAAAGAGTINVHVAWYKANADANG